MPSLALQKPSFKLISTLISIMKLLHTFSALFFLLGASQASAIPYGNTKTTVVPHDNTTLQERSPNTRPIYAIAHRVLMTTGVWDALNDGANALEIDMMPNKGGWNAQHDDTIGGRGDTAEQMFKTIAEARSQGKPVTFIWLDLKGPDWCLPEHGPKWSHCTVQALRDLAAKHLEPVGVKVMYGFYTGREVSLPLTAKDLKAFESLNMNGKAQDCLDVFNRVAPRISPAQLIMSYGYFSLPLWFGNCREKDWNTCTELRKGHEMSKFGKVFGWTSLQGQAWYVDKLLGEAGVDGIIYGRQVNHYVSSSATKEAAADILNWVKRHTSTHHVATLSDSPW